MAVYDNKLLKGDQLTYLVSLIKAADNGKQDALEFNTAYNASSNKVATMSDVPTNNNQLTNGAGYQTASDVSTAINTAIGGLTSFHFEIVQTLPQSNIDTNAIYLVLKSTSSSGNVYTEYAYVKTGTTEEDGETVDVYNWEILGDTQADISTLSNLEVQTIWTNTPAAV